MVRTSLSLLTLSLLAVSLLIGAPVAVSVAGSVDDEVTPFRLAIDRAERSLASGDLEGARALVQRALERDRRSTVAWDLRARWAKVAGDRDEQVYARHQQYRLAVAQGFPRREVAALKKALLELDPLAVDLMGMKDRFLKKLEPIAKQYEKSGRPHSAIRVSKQILALDPENLEARAAIERIAASPDPSLAGDAKPKDLFEDVTDEWMAEFDAEHGEWKEAGELKRENYITVTDAGYEVLVRTAEAMEQMNAFYRQFFRFGTEEHGGSVPRIRVHVFKTRDEYLTLGIGPPIEWSAGHFTGGAVECYVENGFMNMVGVLFHEAAHQFVSLATSSVGWLNEGLASFFEGTRILPNGTVIMNMPANGRLFPLATRMEKGWMAHAADGFNPADSSSTPETAPTFRIVVENRYGWGPPWYAPTWGLVYFLYNYQDPVDGRYVYRTAFMEFVDKSGGKSGNTAVKTFEEVVLANPKKPFKGVERLDDDPQVVLPQTIDEVDAVWKQWILELRDEVSGISDTVRPYLQWGRYAVQNDEHLAAREHFEKGLVSQPDDLELLLEFADLLQDHFKNPDRAAKLALEALYFLERAEEPDEDRIKDVERILNKLDPKRKTLTRIQDDMAEAAHAIVESYAAEGLDLMVMDVAWRAARDLRLDEMVRPYAEAVARSGKSLAIWELAYNEQNLDGWVGGAPVFDSDGSRMVSSFGTYDAQRFDFNFLTLDRVTSGDFSMEAEISAEPGEINFCGFVFGQKDPSSFHGLLFFPGNDDADDSGRAVDTGYLDLMSSYGSGAIRTWLHVPVDTSVDDTRTTSEIWRRLRLDVVGSNVDIWYEGELVGIWEFPSRDVLHGGFGLLTGPGQARYRNVRFLSRDILDPAGAVERGKRMAALEESGGTVGGSYQGRVPPFPEVADWIQGERSAWDEVGPVPQLLVLFSKGQNELVRIDQWLTSLAERHSKVGLEIVCIAQASDGPELEAYLADHPLPGAVGVDLRPGEGFSFGATFETFSVPRFNLPRLVLLDLDGTVVWEGDPGFGVGVPPMAPYPSFLDDPLEDLIVRRRLESLAIWRRGWPAAREALTRGDLAAALPTLRGAIEFDGRYAPQARKASGALRALEDALADLSGTAERFAELGRDPALELLLDWATLAGVDVDKRTRRSLRPVLGSKASKDWEKVSQTLARFAKRRGEASEKATGLLEDLGSRKGAFVVDLTSELRAAAEAGDWQTFDALVAEAPTRPLRWLARSHLGW